MKRDRVDADADDDVLPEYTCCFGPGFSSEVPITTGTIVRLVEALQRHFGPGYEFRPEPITEGGIQMTAWPGKHDPSAYKTVRFHVESNCKGHGSWPWIDEGTWREWCENVHLGLETPIWYLSSAANMQRGKKKKRASKLIIDTFLKAFHGAPCWTPESIGLLINAMEAVGLTRRRSRLPKKKDLKTIGDLGARTASNPAV